MCALENDWTAWTHLKSDITVCSVSMLWYFVYNAGFLLRGGVVGKAKIVMNFCSLNEFGRSDMTRLTLFENLLHSVMYKNPTALQRNWNIFIQNSIRFYHKNRSRYKIVWPQQKKGPYEKRKKRILKWFFFKKKIWKNIEKNFFWKNFERKKIIKKLFLYGKKIFEKKIIKFIIWKDFF